MQQSQQTFIIIALPGIIFVALVALIREKPKTAVVTVDAAQSEPFLKVIRPQLSTYILLYTGMAGMLSCTLGLLSWVPAILVREFQFSPEQVGASYGYVVLVMCPIGVFLGGMIADGLQKAGNARAYTLVLLGTALAALPLIMLLPVVGSSTGLLILLGALHFVISMPQGVAAAFIQIITVNSVRSRMSAIYVMAGNVTGLGVVPILIGHLSDMHAGSTSGLRIAVFYVLAAAAAIAIATLLPLFLRFRPVMAVSPGKLELSSAH